MAAQHSGRLELTWTDKDKALLSAADGKYDYKFVEHTDPRVLEVRVLHEVDRFNFPVPDNHPEGLPVPTAENLLITGDAMHALNALRKTPEWAAKYVGKIKLVYIDPPFNTGQTFDHYDDNIDHSIWLTMLRDRMKQLKSLLAEDGSIWVHLDYAEVHRCRAVMDEELGIEGFVAEVVWQKVYTVKNSAKHFSKDHDTILVYAKSKATWVRNRLSRSAAMDARYANPDNDYRGPWKAKPLHANKSYSKGLYSVTTPSGRVIPGPPPGTFWRISEDELKRLDADGQVWWGKEGNGTPNTKTYLGKVEGKVPQTIWRYQEVGHNDGAKNEIKALFPDTTPFGTPKPERLLHRIITIATNPGDIVLDCFAGSGTTAAVAQKMGRRWVTSELLPDTVETFTKPRLLKVVAGKDLGGITTSTERVSAKGINLPKDVTPEQAKEFQTLLGRVLENPPMDEDGEEHEVEPLELDVASSLTSSLKAANKAGISPFTAEEMKVFLALLKRASAEKSVSVVDINRRVKSDLTKRTKTSDFTTQHWFGGGGFSHYAVGPSMYDVDDESGDVYLSELAANGNWSQSVAAQLKFTLTPNHPVFCGVRGRQRLAVIDGVADEIVVRTVVEHLGDKERTVVVAKVVLPEAEALLEKLSPGSRLKKAPRDLFPKRTVK